MSCATASLRSLQSRERQAAHRRQTPKAWCSPPSSSLMNTLAVMRIKSDIVNTRVGLIRHKWVSVNQAVVYGVFANKAAGSRLAVSRSFWGRPARRGRGVRHPSVFKLGAAFAQNQRRSVRVLLLVPPAAEVHVEHGAGFVVLEGREVDLDHDLPPFVPVRVRWGSSP